MKTVYDHMLALLRSDPRARERKNKERAIRLILIEKHPSLKEIDRDVLIAAMKTYASLDRAWRKTTEEHPELRGEDYYEKFQLEDAKRAELGYNTRSL